MKNLKYLPHLTVLFLITALFHHDEDCYYSHLCIDYPYGFYVLLRFVVCGYFVYTLYRFSRTGNHPAKFIICCLLAITYNPFIKISLSVDIWLIINAFSIITIIFLERKITK